MKKNSVRAFEGNYEFYILQKDIPCIKAGAVFYWDKEDDIRGSMAAGCLKLCWTSDGNCYDGYCADTIVFHANARDEKEWFKAHEEHKVEMTVQQIEEMLGYGIRIISE